MSTFLTRRNFLQWGVGAGLCARPGVGADPGVRPTGRDDPGEAGEDYFAKLGVVPFINAAGTYTVLSASTMPPPVRAAINRAALSPVNLDELLKAAGVYLAKRLRCESALVTDGAASAMTLATAACMTRGRQQAILNVPGETPGLPDEVLVQRTHRYGYDHAIRNCGVKMVEVVTLEDYDRAFTPRTAMAHFFNAAEKGEISREGWVRVAHKHGVPASIDAAADVPPASRLWEYTEIGFDLVQFSGGKGLQGPQNSGLLLGKKDLIEAARLNNSPFSDSIGRGMKVSKEQIVGMVAAVDWYLSQDEQAMQAEYQRRADVIAANVREIPSVETRSYVPPVANHVPHLQITYDPKRVKITPREVQEELRRGRPRIELNPATGENNAIVVGVWMMLPGEEVIVARRLREVLARAA